MEAGLVRPWVQDGHTKLLEASPRQQKLVESIPRSQGTPAIIACREVFQDVLLPRMALVSEEDTACSQQARARLEVIRRHQTCVTS